MVPGWGGGKGYYVLTAVDDRSSCFCHLTTAARQWAESEEGTHAQSLGSVRKEGEGGRDVEIVATMTNLPALCESELE